MCATKNPYVDADAVTEGLDEEVAKTRKGKKFRPSSQQSIPATRTLDRAAAARSQEEISRLKERLVEAEKSAGVVYKMLPVTGKEAPGQILEIETDLIDLLPANKRIQEYLDEAAVSDILPEFRRSGQLIEGILRKKDDGRYELIDGSRRLFCARLLGLKFKAWVGSEWISDADAERMSDTNNLSKEISPREVAEFYGRKIESKTYPNWNTLGDREGLPKSVWSNYKALYEAPVLLVKAHPSPNDLPASLAIWWRSTLNKTPSAESALTQALEDVIRLKESNLKEGIELPNAKYIRGCLTKALSEYKQKKRGRKSAGSSIYTGAGGAKAKTSVSRTSGNFKIELIGVDEEVIEAIVAEVKRSIGAK